MTPTVRKILLPTDFSAWSGCAAAYAAVLAKRLGASVHVINVLDDSPMQPTPWPWQRAAMARRREAMYQQRRARLSEVAATLREVTDRVSIEVRTGTPAEAITEAAIAYGADLIVMGTHGRGGLPHLVLGSVAERVIRAAPCPVLAVRPSGAARVHPARRVG